MADYQWYPGHMTKALRQMKEDIKLVDMLIEVIDARIPIASRNPQIEELGQNKSRVILLNKADLADDEKNMRWKACFEEKGCFAVLVDSRNRGNMKPVKDAIEKAGAQKKQRDKKRGILNRPVRAMIVGIPNVGKSTFINSYAGKKSANTGNKPGVTRGKQWIRLNKDVELLDTPGILWPKFEDKKVGEKLAVTGSIKDELIPKEELSLSLIEFLKREYNGLLNERYLITESLDAVGILNEIAQNRNCLKSGGQTDTQKAAKIILDEFKSGILGKITLEDVPKG